MPWREVPTWQNVTLQRVPIQWKTELSHQSLSLCIAFLLRLPASGIHRIAMRISTRLRTTVPGLGTALQQCQCRAVSTTHGHDQARTQRRAELATKINQTLKDDKHAAQVELRPDTKTVSTPVGDLPISPVMDPAWMEAKERFKTPKAKQTKGKDGGRFRKKLFLNPYGSSFLVIAQHHPTHFVGRRD